jgi:DNA (cytosine-5)-methyltransferase 1
MKFGSVCSGIEAASVAWNKLGWSASWLAEIEPFPSAVLAHHYPDVPNLGDMTQLPEKILSGEIEAPDIFCGGTPCQAFSIAGNRNSLDDARGNLSLTFCEIANAIDSVRDVPAIIFWENVPGVLNTKDNAFGCFLAGLAGEDGELKPAGKKWTNAGCVFGTKRTVAWRVLDAQYFGLAQRRKRVFVVASARDGFDPAEVLFEFDGLRRDTATSRISREATATNAQSGIGTYNKQRIGEYSTEDVASTCAARDYKDATDLVTYEHAKTVYEMHAQDARVQDVGDVLPTMSATYGSGGGNIPVTYGIQSTVIGRKPENGPKGSGYSEDISFTQTKTDVHAVAYNITFCDANGTRKDLSLIHI